MKTMQQTEEIRFEKSFPLIEEFMVDCQNRLYRKILSIYEDLYKLGLKEKKLIVRINAHGVAYDSDFVISKDNNNMLTDVSKYFEEIEDYETCGKILRMCKNLKKY